MGRVPFFEDDSGSAHIHSPAHHKSTQHSTDTFYMMVDGFCSKYRSYTQENPGKTLTAVFVCKSANHRSVAVSHGINLWSDTNTALGLGYILSTALGKKVAGSMYVAAPMEAALVPGAPIPLTKIGGHMKH